MSAQLPTVQRQHAALTVDTETQSLSGWTELHVTPPPAAAATGGATLGLHCYGLSVQSVAVNGLPVQFDLQPPVREDLPESVTAAAYDSPQRQAGAAADYCFYMYERQLQRERQPELVFTLPDSLLTDSSARGGSGKAGGRGGRELRIRVEYGGGGGGAGVRFWEQFAASDNQVRRASAWLPCVDTPSASVQFKLDLTCRAEQVAVGPGTLLRQSWADSGRRWRTFHYEVPIGCPPCQLGLAVGPLQAEATSQGGAAAAAAAAATATTGGSGGPAESQPPKQFTHFAPRKLPPELAVAAVLAKPPSHERSDDEEGGVNGSGKRSSAAAATGPLARSGHFFSLVFSLFEELLGVRFPLPAMQQVFLPPELLLSSSQALAGLQVLSTAQLIQPRAIEQSIAARCAMARCLARQWFGVLLRAATPLDEWLIEGLSGWLEEQYVKRYMGRNELAYRRWCERQSIFLADNGEAPPLAASGVPSPSPWGPLYGTERLDPSRLWATKATAVVAMLEKRAGEDLFRKHVGMVAKSGLAALAAEQAAAEAAAEQAAARASEADAGAAATAAAGAAGTAGTGPSPLKLVVVASGLGAAGAAGAAAAGEGGAPTRVLDTMTFLNDLGRAGSFRKEMSPFAARWIYGRGVPHITAAFIYHSRVSVLELALKQTGSESAKRAADIAHRAAAEGSNAGIVKAVVRETEGDQYVDHPVHLGSEAFVLTELKVTPVVEKKQPGRRPKKRKLEGGEGEENEEDEAAAAAAALDPVRWVRLDPASELLCDIRLMQPDRMLAAQLMHSRDVVAQAEAVQRLGELRVTTQGVRAPAGLEALRRTLADRSVFYRVRCDVAMALSGLRDESGQPAGLPILLDFYKSAYFHPSSDVPRTVAIADPSEYYVAQAVVTAVSFCREPEGTTPIDALIFLLTCLQEYSTASGAPFSDYGLVAAMCASLGNLHLEGSGGELLTLLEKFLERDTVLVSPGSSVGCACLLAMAALCASGTCSPEEAERVATAARRVRSSRGLTMALRHAALAAALQLAAAQQGPAAAVQLAATGALGALAGGGSGKGAGGLAPPCASTAALLLEEAAAVVTAANSEAAGTAAAAAAILGEASGAAMAGVEASMPLLQQLAGLLNAGQDCRVRHLAFVLLQLLAAQPPTLYRPPATEAEDTAAFLAAAGGGAAVPPGQTMSMGVTHRTGGAQQASHGTAAAAAAAPKIKLQLPTGRAGAARSMGVSGPSVAISAEGPAVSDARMDGLGGGGGEVVDQFSGLPPAAQGQVFSPARLPLPADAAYAPGGYAANGGGGWVAGSQQQQEQVPVGADIMAAFGAPQVAPAAGVPPLPPPQQQQQAQAAPAPKVLLKMAPSQAQQQQQAPGGRPAEVQQPQQPPLQQQQQRKSSTPSLAPGAGPAVGQAQQVHGGVPPAPEQFFAPDATAWPPMPLPAPAEAAPPPLAPPPAAPPAAQPAAAKPITKIKLKLKFPPPPQ